MHATQGVDVQNLIKIHLAVAGLRMREKTGLGAFLLTCLSFYPVLELPGGRGGFPPHCGCQSPPLFVLLTSPRGTVFVPGTAVQVHTYRWQNPKLSRLISINRVTWLVNVESYM